MSFWDYSRFSASHVLMDLVIFTNTQMCVVFKGCWRYIIFMLFGGGNQMKILMVCLHFNKYSLYSLLFAQSEKKHLIALIFSCKHDVVRDGLHLTDLLLFVLPLSSFLTFFLPLTLPPSPLPSFPVPRPYRPCSSWWLPSRCLSTFGATRRFPTSTGMKKRLQLYWKPGRGDTLR